MDHDDQTVVLVPAPILRTWTKMAEILVRSHHHRTGGTETISRQDIDDVVRYAERGLEMYEEWQRARRQRRLRRQQRNSGAAGSGGTA